MDIFLNFRTGVFVNTPDDVEVVEYDRWRVAVSYSKTWFLLDVVSGVPFAAIELILNGGGSGADGGGAGALKNVKILKLLRFLKLGRLLKLEKILSNLDRDALDRIEDFLQVSGFPHHLICFIILHICYFITTRDDCSLTKGWRHEVCCEHR